MLSEVEVVRARNAIESTYIGICEIVEKQEVLQSDMTTLFVDVVAYSELPCRLSYESITVTNQNQLTGVNQSSKLYLKPIAKVGQKCKLFISPDIKVSAGSIIKVLQNGNENYYGCSSEAAIYQTHQEVIVELVSQFA